MMLWIMPCAHTTSIAAVPLLVFAVGTSPAHLHDSCSSPERGKCFTFRHGHQPGGFQASGDPVAFAGASNVFKGLLT